MRDSGAIEQDADIVALIHREDNPDGTTGQYAELIFDKIRAGERGIDPLLVDFGHCRFRLPDMDSYQFYLDGKKAEAKKVTKGGFPG